jgi:hypothetical protein
MQKEQNYNNHVRYYPPLHFVTVPLLLINLVYQSVRLYQDPTWDRGMFVLLSAVFILMMPVGRLQILKVQDRLIRLEEGLRYERLLSKEAAREASKLRLGQKLALRFASDEELPELVARTAAGEFRNNKEIKQAIKDWRGDHHRA